MPPRFASTTARTPTGNDKTLCLIYTPYLQNAICETQEAHPRAWTRNGSQSVLMNQEMRDQLRIRKGLLDTEGLPCCPFSADDVDGDVLNEFRRVFHPDGTRDFTDERLLYDAGAIVRANGEYAFTIPGLLFFASNPQRVLPHAYVRLMRFLVPSRDYRSRGAPAFDKSFVGRSPSRSGPPGHSSRSPPSSNDTSGGSRRADLPRSRNFPPSPSTRPSSTPSPTATIR